MRLGQLVARLLLILAILVVLGLGGSLFEGRGSFRRRWRALRGRIGVVAVVLVILGAIGFAWALTHPVR